MTFGEDPGSSPHGLTLRMERPACDNLPGAGDSATCQPVADNMEEHYV